MEPQHLVDLRRQVPEAFVERADGIELKFHQDQLFLFDPEIGEFSLDFLSEKGLYQRKVLKGKSEILAKALGSHRGNKTVFDATLGLAQDAIFIRQLGFEVSGCERAPMIYALLQDALWRARIKRPDMNLKIQYGSAIELLKNISIRPEAIYLDPMFPEKKKSALPRKEMQIFRKVVGDDSDVTMLFEIAMQTAEDCVVVKRPLKAPYLQGKPTHSFEGQTVRYDFYSRRGG